MLRVYVMKNTDNSEVGVVIATDDQDAFVQLAFGIYGEEDHEDSLAHVRKLWKIEKSSPIDKSKAVLWGTIDMSEGYNVHLQ